MRTAGVTISGAVTPGAASVNSSSLIPTAAVTGLIAVTIGVSAVMAAPPEYAKSAPLASSWPPPGRSTGSEKATKIRSLSATARV